MARSKIYNIGGLLVKVIYQSPFLFFDTSGGSSHFETESKSCDWMLSVNCQSVVERPKSKLLVHGVQEFEESTPYKWSIYERQDQRLIFVEFENHLSIVKAIAAIDESKHEVSVHLELKSTERCYLDPFFHPLGILVIKELVDNSEGFLIHASGVDDNTSGYLFTAVSGTGKSTMARLWAEKGAKIINDDRLIVDKDINGHYKIHNTPMPYYADHNKNVQLKACFILKQAKVNSLKKLADLQSVVGLMGNCIQHFYDEQHVTKYLTTIERLVAVCPVYEVGFKPDTEIVDLIREELGNS